MSPSRLFIARRGAVFPTSPPPDIPPAGSLANVWLPMNGSAIPYTDGANYGGFTNVDFQGYGSSPNARISEVTHPGNPAKKALRFYLVAGDVAGHYGGHRCELYRKPGDLDVGITSWTAFSWWLPTSGYTLPSITSTLVQVHGGDYDPNSNQSPAQMFGIEPNNQMRLYIRDAPTSDYFFGASPRDVEIRGLLKVVHAINNTGAVQFWLKSDGTTPNEGNTPSVSASGIVTNALPPGLASYSKLGIYSQPASPTCTAYCCGYGRADTAARAKYLAGW